MTISVHLVIWLWFVHWVADFILQTSEQAAGKSTSNVWLTKHVVTYTAVIALGVMLYDVVTPVPNRPLAGVFVYLNGALHWTTDYFTSRYNARMWKEGRVHDFFVGVGFDQFIHLTTLVLTAWWLLT